MNNLLSSGLNLRTLTAVEYATLIEDLNYNFVQILNLPGFKGMPGASITGPEGIGIRGSDWIFVTLSQMQSAYSVTSVEQINLQFINQVFLNNPTLFFSSLTIPNDTQLLLGDILVLPSGTLIQLTQQIIGGLPVIKFSDTGITFSQVVQLSETRVIEIFNQLFNNSNTFVGALKHYNAVAKNVSDQSPALNQSINSDSVIDIVTSNSGPGVPLTDTTFVAATEQAVSTLTKMCFIAGSPERYHELVQSTQLVQTNNYAPGIDDFAAHVVLQNSYSNGILFGSADSESIRQFGRLYRSVNATVLTSSYSPLEAEFSELNLLDTGFVLRGIAGTINVTTLDLMSVTDYSSKFISYSGNTMDIANRTGASVNIYAPAGIRLKNVMNASILSTDATGKIVNTYSVITALSGAVTNNQILGALALYNSLADIGNVLEDHENRITTLESADTTKYFQKISYLSGTINFNALNSNGDYIVESGSTISNFAASIVTAPADMHVNTFVSAVSTGLIQKCLQEVTFSSGSELAVYSLGVKWFRQGTKTGSGQWSWSNWSKALTNSDKVLSTAGLTASGSFATNNMTVNHNAKATGLIDTTNTDLFLLQNLQFDAFGHVISHVSLDIVPYIVPTAAVIYLAKNVAPAGFLKANGAYVDKTTYNKLWLAIGTTYGSDTSTQFKLPDLRGQFIRAWSDGSTIDSGRAFGSTQLDAVGPHSHPIENSDDFTGGGNGVTAANLGASPNLAYTRLNTGIETRPKNIALLGCIKY